MLEIKSNESLVTQINKLKDELQFERNRSNDLTNKLADYEDGKLFEDDKQSLLIDDRYKILENEIQDERKKNKKLEKELCEMNTTLKIMEPHEKITNTHKIGHVKTEIYELSKKLVKEGEKNVTLALDLQKSKDEVNRLKHDCNLLRSMLFRGINGGILDAENYSHITLVELLRIRIQELDRQYKDNSSKSFHSSMTNHEDESFSMNQDIHDCTSSELAHGIQKFEKKIMSMQHLNDNLKKKCAKLENKTQTLKSSDKQIIELNKKITQVVERSRHERDIRAKTEKELSTTNKKVEVLSDHIEKLMIHLKHEAVAKVRALSDQVKTQRELEMLRSRNVLLTKRNDRKDRAIIEIKEGGKILEDQLRIMDEKFMELRMKLDWTRTQSERLIQKKEDESKDLRAKFAILSNLSTRNDKKVSYFFLVKQCALLFDFPSIKV